MYRIFLTLVTSIFVLGCGSPSESRVYDLEKRVAAVEKANDKLSNSVKASGSQTVAATEEITALQRKLDARLSELEKTAAQIVEEQKKELDARSGPPPKSLGIVALEKRVTELELKDSSANSGAFGRSLVPTDADDTIPADTAGAVAKKGADTHSKRHRNRKPRKFETTLFSWNVESEGSDPEVIAKQLSEMNRYDIYGLCEVLPESIELFTSALGDDYRTIASRSGFNDRLQIIYNENVYRLLRRLELNDINYQFRYRSPLVAHFEHRATGQQLMVMNNHLARGRATVRTKQAEQLVQWARDQNVPVVAIGDYNFDYVFRTRKGNDGFAAMLGDNIWQWVEPVELIDTNWFDNPKSPDGRDDYEGSMLDFAFVAGAAKTWKKQCRIIVRPDDFPDDETTSDHRPFELKLSVR